MTDLTPKPSWDRLPTESEADYAHFERWLSLGSQRTIHRVALRQGASKDLIKQLHDQHDWVLRARDFDAALAVIVKEHHVDNDQALAVQGQLGELLIDAGLKGMALKNEAMLSVKQLTELIKLGAELVHRASGAADVRVSVDTKEGIEDLVGRLLPRTNE